MTKEQADNIRNALDRHEATMISTHEAMKSGLQEICDEIDKLLEKLKQ